MVGDEDNVRITTANPSSLQQASVDLEITVPPDMRPSVQNGAGSVLYQGPAAGECIFSTGAGSITLKLPADVNVEVYLSVGAGSITVDFPVDGQVSTHVVEGTIGTGADGSVDARVGAGTIAVQRQ